MNNTINLESYRKQNREKLEFEKRLYIIALGVELLEILAPINPKSTEYVIGALIDKAETLAEIHSSPDAIERKKEDFAELFAELTGRAKSLRKKYEIEERTNEHERKGSNGHFTQFDTGKAGRSNRNS